MERFPLWWLIYSRPQRAVRVLRVRTDRLERAIVRLG
jgi:hypothetical protein